MLVLLEKTGTGYRASSGKPLEAETEGATREQALNNLRDLLVHRLEHAELVNLDLPGECGTRLRHTRSTENTVK